MPERTDRYEWLRKARLAIVEAPFYILNLEKQTFDAEEIVDRVEYCNANLIRLGAARSYAFFQSKIAPLAPSLQGRDFLQEVIQAAQPRGIKLIPYIQSGYENNILYQQHPNWVERLADGRPMAVGRPEEVHMCWNSPYREWKISVIREICANYEVDGMYLDGPTYFGYCYCDYCRTKFGAEHHMDIPRQEDWHDPAWQAYVVWRYEVLASVLQDICDAVRSTRPGIPVINNNITYFHERCRRESRIPEILTRISDGMLLESHRTHQRLAWHRVGQNAKYGYATGKPLWMWWEYTVGEWSFTACSPAELRLKYAELLANKAAPGVFPFDVVGRAPQGLDALRECFGFQSENEARLFSAEPVKHVALPYSRQTAEWYGADQPDERYTATHTGLYRALVHNHVPFNVVLDPDLSDAGLAGYDAVILSNVACVSETQAEAIRRYVQKGGGLIATYETSLFDERGHKRGNFPLADVFGADYQASPTLQVRGELAPGYAILENRQEWVMWLEEPIRGGNPHAVAYIDVPPRAEVPFQTGVEGAVVPVGKHTYVRVRPGAQGAGCLRRPSQRSQPLGDPTPYPGAVTNTYGRGRVVYFPADIGHDYSQVRVPFLTTILQNALEWVSGRPRPVSIQAPTSVEVQLHTGPDRTNVYLINFTGDSIEPRDEVTQVARLREVPVQVAVARPVKQVFHLNRKETLNWKMEGGRCSFVVPDLDEFAVISLEFAD
ncbi:MAG TPA: hypothetical protein DEP84_07530 [Chloroflexi bacterium]|nr:hypothetical protein [Chloroflexota bacterium]